jgi:hypothetical protein
VSDPFRRLPLEFEVDRERRFLRVTLAGEVLVEGTDLPIEIVEAAVGEALLRHAGAPPEAEVHFPPEALAELRAELKRLFEEGEEDEDADEEDDEGGFDLGGEEDEDEEGDGPR